jgi:hypothetical protein
MNIEKRSVYLITLVGFLTFSFSGCVSDKKDVKDAYDKQSEDVVTVDSIDRELIQDVRSVKEMFYSMPSPLEVAMLLKEAGATYNPELLNSLDKSSNYVTTKNMALNLGIYTTDLSYSSLYDQTQTTINYINAAKEMAEGLGILNVLDRKTVQRLQANVNNREVILDIISGTIMNTSAYFKDNEQKAISTIVLIGGWIEGLYIATNLVQDNPNQYEINNNKMIARIADQKMAINTIEKLIEEGQSNEDLVAVSKRIDELVKVYDQIAITSSSVVPVKDTATNVTTLKSETNISMSPETYKQLKEKINVIRNGFTS